MANERPTDSLREEHAAVLKKLEALERIVTNPDRQPETVAELKTLAGFFQTDFWVHFAKEEEALFLEMERYTLADKGPLGAMLREHLELRNSNERWQAAVAGYLGDTESAWFVAPMKEQCLHFIWMLRDHINKEDNMLFIVAEQWLDAAQKVRLNQLFREIEVEYAASAKQS